MKKSSIADQIEEKIRRINDRYKHLKNCSSENILRQQSLPKNPINDIIRQDLKTHLPIIKLQISRDVSHLQKQKTPKATSIPFPFPTDLKKLKALMDTQIATESNSTNNKVPTETHHRKVSGIEEQTIEYLEKIDHAYPSSRKEAENLMSWFLDMKNRYENDQDFETVVVVCEQELTKSVWVECKNRGDLLKMLFAYYHSISIRNKELGDDRLKEVIKGYEEKIRRLEKKLEDLSNKLFSKSVELTNLVKKNEEIVKNLEDDVSFFKKKLQEMQKLYLDEQELWKKQWMNASRRRTVSKNVVLLHDSYNLAVTRLRGDLFPPTQPTFPEDLKKKIDNGEALDVTELQQYREALVQFQQEVHDLQVCDVEVQTEDIIKDAELLSQASSNKFEEPFQGVPNKVNEDLVLVYVVNEDQNVKKDDQQLEKDDGKEQKDDLKVENQFLDKEVQTDDVERGLEQFNDSELEEIQNLLENDGIEGLEGIEDEEEIESKIGNWMAGLGKRNVYEHIPHGGGYESEGGPFRSLVLARDTLDVVEESGFEQDWQNNTPSGEKFEDFEENKEFIEGDDQKAQDDNRNFKKADRNFQSFDGKVGGFDEKIQGVGRNVQSVDRKVQGVDRNAKGIDSNAQGLDRNVQGLDRNVQGLDRNVQGVNMNIGSSEGKNKSKTLKEKKEISTYEKNERNIQSADRNIQSADRHIKRTDENIQSADRNIESSEGKNRIQTEFQVPKKKSKLKRNSEVVTKILSLYSSPKPQSEVSTPKTPKHSSFSEAISQKSSPEIPKMLNNLNEIRDHKKISMPPTFNPLEENKTLEKPFKLQNPQKKPKKTDLEGISENDSNEDSIDEPQVLNYNPLFLNTLPSSDPKSLLPSGSVSALPPYRSPELQSSEYTKQTALLHKTSEKSSIPKRSSNLINIKEASERRGSMQVSLNNPALKDISNIKLTTLALISKIQQKKKELAEIEQKIEEKKKILNETFESESSESSDVESLNGRKRMSAKDLMHGVLKRISLAVPEANEDHRRKSVSVNVIKQLLTEELKKRSSVNVQKRRKSFVQDPIEEEEESDQELEKFDPKVWKKGYIAGFVRGKHTGFHSGKTVGREEGVNEGYSKAFKDIQNTSLNEDSDRIKNNPSESSLNSTQFKWKRAQNEIKSTKELTKFTEFKFAKQKNSIPKPPNPAPELIKTLMKKSKEALERKAKSGKKMVNKLIASTYSNASSKSVIDSPEELLEICYEEFSQRYGLKKVTDRKFMEFLASLLKVKNYKKPAMFIKLTGFGKALNLQTYSKFTVNLYLASLNYMLTSKIGITMNYEESDDRNLFPVNRGLECVREKLEGIVDRGTIQGVVNTLESRAVPDPQRISTALVELEYVLELICENYEIQQKKVQKGAIMVFKALGYEQDSLILQYDLALAIRFICPHKFSRMESEENVIQELTIEETLEICIEMNVLSEHDVQSFVKSYAKVPFENYTELLGVVDTMEKVNTTWISVDEVKWRERLDKCQKTFDPSSQFAVIAWRIYESELKRIEMEFLS